MPSITNLCWCFMDIFSFELFCLLRKLFLKIFLSHKNYLLFSIIVSISLPKTISHCSAFSFMTKTFVLKTMLLHCTLNFHYSTFQRSSFFSWLFHIISLQSVFPGTSFDDLFFNCFIFIHIKFGCFISRIDQQFHYFSLNLIFCCYWTLQSYVLSF